MATVEEKNHDSSTTIGDHYSSVTDPDGALTVAAGAALDSSTYGVKADFDAGTSLIFLADTLSYSGGGFALRFMVNIANLSASTGSATVMTAGADEAATIHDQLITMRSNVGNTAFEVSALTYDDGTGSNRTTSRYEIPSSGEVCIEMRVTKETADGNNDGTLRLYIDSVLKETISDLQNFNSVNDFDRWRVSFSSNIAAISGYIYFDEMILDSDSEASLGCSDPSIFSGYSLVLGGGQP